MAHKLRYRHRIDSHGHRGQALARMFGCAGVVRTGTLTLCQQLYRQGETDPGRAHLQKTCITRARRTAEGAWLAQVATAPLQQALRDPDCAFCNW